MSVKPALIFNENYVFSLCVHFQFVGRSLAFGFWLLAFGGEKPRENESAI